LYRPLGQTPEGLTLQYIGNDRRKEKRVANWLRKKCGWGKYVESCRGHPGIVVKTCFPIGDLWGDSVDIKSLVDGVVESCSLRHCGIYPMPNAVEQAEYWKKHGKNAAWAKFDPVGLHDCIDAWGLIPADADPETRFGAGMPVHEYLGFTKEEYDEYVVKGNLP